MDEEEIVEKPIMNEEEIVEKSIMDEEEREKTIQEEEDEYYNQLMEKSAREKKQVMEEEEHARFIPQIIPKESLRIYDIVEKTTKDITFPDIEEFPWQSATRAAGNVIYIAGNKYIGTHQCVLKVDCLTGEVTKLKFMINPRCDFPLLVVNNYLYAIGGYTNCNKLYPGVSSVTRDCEIYDLKPLRGCVLYNIAASGNEPKKWPEDGEYVKLRNLEKQSWKLLPKLNTGRYGHSATYFKPTDSIYIFGGYINEYAKSTSSIEQLNISKKDQMVWVNIEVKGDVWRPISRIMCNSISSTEILIYGDLGANFVFHVEEEKMEEIRTGGPDVDFLGLSNYYVSPAIFEGNIYCYNDNQHNLITYSIQRRGWSKIYE